MPSHLSHDDSVPDSSDDVPVAEAHWFDPKTLSDRAYAWAATMDGHTAADPDLAVRTAHRDSSATVEPSRPVLREEREALLLHTLAGGATQPVGAGHRQIPEEPDPVRTCFERDRDRILHGSAFRRLAGKTQVFIFPGDHQRTRLTHALEVAQVARSIASACRLNVALAEAIAIGHDCGHGPGGHASEDALSPYIEGGYDHATWGADVVLAPLNLCQETLDGIRNHSWSRPAPMTPEGEVVSWADRIAYVCHDFEDAVAAGLVRPADLPSIVRERCGDSRSSQLNAFILGMVEAISATGRISMTDYAAEALAEFRKWNYERIYLRPDSQDQGQSVHRMLQALVEYYANRPELLPEVQRGINRPDKASTAAYRLAVTYVGGMTDRFACSTALQRLQWEPSDLPRGIDTGP
jgi:dGTPase